MSVDSGQPEICLSSQPLATDYCFAEAVMRIQLLHLTTRKQARRGHKGCSSQVLSTIQSLVGGNARCYMLQGEEDESAETFSATR